MPLPLARRTLAAALLPLTAASLALGCGGPPTAEVGAGAPEDVVEQTLRAGQPARAIVLLDEAPALAAARATGPGLAASAELAAALLDDTKASLLAESTSAELEVVRGYHHLPAMQVELRSPGALERLRARPEVVRVVPDEPHEAFLDQSLPLIHQPAGYAIGATGEGTAVAVLDTGLDYTRAAFGSCPAPGEAGCSVAYARDFAPDDGQLDASGHGTNVAGVVLGVAPRAKVLALDVFNGPYAYSSDILAAIDWVVQNRAAYHIVAMNLSLGSGGAAAPCTGDVFAGAIRTARAAGVLAAIASGNNGYRNMISSPACAPDAVSVGAVWDASYGPQAFTTCTDTSTAADKVACFSNSASFLTVLAPGAYVTAAGITMAGTSQAAPHVAGGIAALESLYPRDTPDQIVARLRSGPRITDARNGLQLPRLDLGGLIPPGCVVSVTPASAALSGAGATATVEVAAPADCAWTASAGSATWLTVSPESGTGPATLTVTAAANAGPARSATVAVGILGAAFTQARDTSLPTGDVSVVGAPYTRSLSVTLTVHGVDPAGVVQMCLLNNTRRCTAWRPFAESLSWTLASGSPGPRYVYVWLKDAAGNVNGPFGTMIVFDNAGPSGGSFTAVRSTGQAALYWGGFADRGSGVVSSYVLRHQVGSAPASCAAGAVVYSGTGTSYLATGLARRVAYGYRICPIDAVGNVGAGRALTVRLP